MIFVGVRKRSGSQNGRKVLKGEFMSFVMSDSEDSMLFIASSPGITRLEFHRRPLLRFRVSHLDSSNYLHDTQCQKTLESWHMYWFPRLPGWPVWPQSLPLLSQAGFHSTLHDEVVENHVGQ